MNGPMLAHETVTLVEAARILGISRAQAYNLVVKGYLPGSFRFGPRGWWRVAVPALQTFLANPRQNSV